LLCFLPLYTKMEIKKNYNLSKLNTFGIDVKADAFALVESEADIKELFKLPEFQQAEKIFLGGGSNVLFTKNFNGIVVLNKLKSIEIIEENSENVSVRAMGGELWNDLVLFAVNHGYWGIENLSLVPGTVGAAPMQNIGAYGTEIKETLFSVETFEVVTGKKKIFSKEECELGYRDSVFKNKLKGKYFITAITLKLSKIPKKNVTYKILKDYLEENKIKVKSSKDISDAVASIRRSKLPDPKILGNAGSFFKNVFVEKNKLTELLEKYPNMPHFEEDNSTKIPAGWLIEQCGPKSGTSWKGYRTGSAGVHEKHSLVLVNYGRATGSEILDLANQIIKSVKDKFDLELTPEVNLI